MLSGNYATQCASAAHGKLKKPIENSSLGGSVDTCMGDTRQPEPCMATLREGKRRTRIASIKPALCLQSSAFARANEKRLNGMEPVEAFL
jgi:hypothetical protein